MEQEQSSHESNKGILYFYDQDGKFLGKKKAEAILRFMSSGNLSFFYFLEGIREDEKYLANSDITISAISFGKNLETQYDL